MSIREFSRSEAEHEARRRLTAEWFDLQPHERRTLLQTLSLADLAAMAHLLAMRRQYMTADLAYRHLRSIISPEPWAPDIVRDDTWKGGPHYVFWFGGQARAARPVNANVDDDPADVALYATAQAFFNLCYPCHLHLVLTEEIWRAPHAA
jgi:hypothetical protein